MVINIMRVMVAVAIIAVIAAVAVVVVIAVVGVAGRRDFMGVVTAVRGRNGVGRLCSSDRQLQGKRGRPLACGGNDKIRVNNVMNMWHVVDEAVWVNQAQYVVAACCSTYGDVELTVAEHLSSEIEADLLQSLPLRLVDGHGVAQSNRKLKTMECYTTRTDLYLKPNSRDFDNGRSVADYLNVYDALRNTANDTSLAIDQAVVKIIN